MTTKAKICGISTPEAMQAALDGGADFVGLVFCIGSPRHIEIAQAQDLARLARGNAAIVALTVDADDATLQRIVDDVAPDYLQLHGHETPERVAAIKQKFGRPVIKAVAVEDKGDVEKAARFRGIGDIILFDAKPAAPGSLPGGNGLTFDWRVLEGVADRMDFMLSGGLTPANIADAIGLTRAAAVDVSSGVESTRGVKDPELIRRFLQAVKTAKQGK